MSIEYKAPYVIGEIGCNHKGSIEIAKEMVDMAKIFCKAPAVKFQKRNIRELLTEEEYNTPHPVAGNAYGSTYGEHREALEFTLEQHAELKAHCEKMGIDYATSVWDIASAKEIVTLKPKFIKLPSACSTHFELISYLCENYEGELHVSLGMTTKEEEAEIVAFLESKNRAKDTIMYACTSGYPIQPEEACLLEIPRIHAAYAHKVKGIGYSGHHNGISIDTAAYTLGAQYIERHYTLDRTWKGTDHAASLEPEGLRRVVRDLKYVRRALDVKSEDILAVEKVQRKKLKWNRQQLNEA